MKLKNALVFFILVLSVGAAGAQEILEYAVHGEISGLNLTQKVLMSVRNNHNTSTLSQISYPFSGNIKFLKSYDEAGGLQSDTEYREGKTYITTKLRKRLSYDEVANITAEFISPNAVSAFNNTYILSTSYSLFANVKMFELALRLPEGTGLKDRETDVVPAPNEMTTDGRAIILKWTESNPKEFRVFIRYEPLPPPTTPHTETPPLPEKTPEPSLSGALTEIIHKNFSAFMFVFSLLFVLIVYSIVAIRRKKKEEELYNRIEILKEDEQLILKLVTESNGIEQRELQDRTNFSKAKLSKILSELEKRVVIRKESTGKKNKIYLAEKMK